MILQEFFKSINVIHTFIYVQYYFCFRRIGDSMLVDFSVENFGPFRDRTTLSMQATSHKEHYDNVIECGSMNLLSSALVFGPNASGKSYLFKAIGYFSRMLDDVFADDFKYPWYEPFKLDPDCLSSPVEFQIRLSEEGVLYDYSISFLSDRVVSESLIYYPMRRAKKVFERKESKEDFKGRGRKILEFLTPTSAYLVLASKYNDELCSKVRKMIRNLIVLESNDIGLLSVDSCKFVDKDEVKRRMLIEGLRKADFGISDYKVIEVSIEGEKVRSQLPPAVYDELFSKQDSIKASRIAVRHRYGGLSDGAGIEGDFDMDREESVGTRYMFGIMGPLVDALTSGKTVFIDEFGSHLHPLLTRWLVEQFSKRNNPNGAQLVAMTHDVGLIDTNDLVRRDQIFFTDKNRDDGSSTLYSLSDFKGVRKGEQVLKGYLLGRYDAIPLVSSKGVMDARED